MVIWGVLLFISGCLCADAARVYDDKGFCGVLDAVKADARCGHLIAATVSCQLLLLSESIMIFTFLQAGAKLSPFHWGGGGQALPGVGQNCPNKSYDG